MASAIALHPQEADTALGRLKVHVEAFEKSFGVGADFGSSCVFMSANDLRDLRDLINTIPAQPEKSKGRPA